MTAERQTTEREVHVHRIEYPSTCTSGCSSEGRDRVAETRAAIREDMTIGEDGRVSLDLNLWNLLCAFAFPPHRAAHAARAQGRAEALDVEALHAALHMVSISPKPDAAKARRRSSGVRSAFRSGSSGLMAGSP